MRANQMAFLKKHVAEIIGCYTVGIICISLVLLFITGMEITVPSKEAEIESVSYYKKAKLDFLRSIGKPTQAKDLTITKGKANQI